MSDIFAQSAGRGDIKTPNKIDSNQIFFRPFSDSMGVNRTGFDSLMRDSTVVSMDSLQVPYANSEISDEVRYNADDSIVYDVSNRKLYLFKNSKIGYTDMKVDAALIDFDWKTMNLTAVGTIDSNGEEVGKPIYMQGEKEYVTNKMIYNFKSKRGKVFDVVTKEGDGYLHGHEVKKDPEQNWYIKDAKYTTCDHEHPHFFIHANRLKLIPNKVIISGPANLVFADVPTPIYLPFGIFPVKTGQRSGLILPNNYGFLPVFNIRGLGYYWAMNDHIGISLTSDIYFNGGFGLHTSTDYNKNYHYTGNVKAGINRTYLYAGDNPFLDNATTEYFFEWTHNQSPKSHPTFTFNSNVNFRTSNYYKNSLVTNNTLTNAIVASNITMVKKFRNKQYYMNAGASSRQDLSTKLITVELPNFYFYVPTFTPFQAKISSANKKWYEKINVGYTVETKLSLTTTDSLFFKKESLDKMQKGVNNTFSVGWNTKLFKYFNINLNSGATDKIYFDKNINYYDPNYADTVRRAGQSDTVYYGKLVSNKINQISNVYDFNIGATLNTTFYGMFNFKSKRLKAIRHQITPTISYNFKPDFGNAKYGYYYNQIVDELGTVKRMSYYEKGIYGTPSIGTQSTISMGISNNFSMKVFDPKDSINPLKKKGLLDQLGISTSYNFALDSVRLSPIVISARTNFGQNFSSDIGVNYTVYAPDANGNSTKTFNVDTKQPLLRFLSFGFNVNFNISSSQVNKKLNQTQKGTEAERRDLIYNYNQYYDFNSPWNISAYAGITGTKSRRLGVDTVLFTASVNLSNFDFNITPKWKVAISSGYDFVMGKVTLTNLKVIRDLHCWEIVFNYTPISVNGQTYNIEIHPKSALLQDLKITRSKTLYDSYFK